MTLIRVGTYYESPDGHQYKLAHGNFEQQHKELREGGFRRLTAPEVRQVIVDDPHKRFSGNWYIPANGIEYVHGDDGVKVYIQPQSRILGADQAEFDAAVKSMRSTRTYPINEDQVSALVQAAKVNSGIYVIDLDTLVLADAFVIENNITGHFPLSTTNYRTKMQDNLDLKQFVYAGFGTGDSETMTMGELRENGIENTRLFVLLPEYVKQKSKQGTGLGCLSLVDSYHYDGSFNADFHDMNRDDLCAFGVRKAK